MRSLLIDKVTDINKSSITGQKYLSINEDIYEHHFPNNPVMPAAYMVEAAIQLCRAYIWRESSFLYTLCPLNIKKFKFHKLIKPGTILEIHSSFIDDMNNLELNSEVKTKVIGRDAQEEIIFEGTIFFKIILFETMHNEELCRNYLEFLFPQ